MKNLCIGFILLWSLVSRAQGFVSFPDSNAIWVNSYSTLSGGMFPRLQLAHTLKFCLSAEDTLIDFQLYSKLYRCGARSDYFGALRSDSGRVSFVPKDSLQALKLYDFNLLPGDTLKNIYCLQGYGPSLDGLGFQLISDFQMGFITVSQVDTIETYQGRRRLIYLSGSGYWVEGIGNSQGLFWDPFGNISGFGIALECMSIGDSTYFQSSWPAYPSALAGSCDLSLNTAELDQVQFQVFPNPSSGRLNLNNSRPSQLIVINANGAVVWTGKVDAGARLDFSTLAKGVYLLRFAGNSYRWIKSEGAGD